MISFRQKLAETEIISICETCTVSNLINQKQSAGKHFIKWDGTDHHGNKLPGGIYIYSLQTAKYILSKDFILIPSSF